MPELPEVQTTVNGLNDTVKNLKIIDIWSDYFLNTKNKNPNSIKNKKYFELFKKEIIGKKIIKAERRGKNILIHLSEGKTILTHMKMTGHFLYGKYEATVHKNKTINWRAKAPESLKNKYSRFIHLVFTLSNKKHLAFSDLRKFAKIFFFNTDQINNIKDISILGIEPLLPIKLETFKKQLNKKINGKIKTVLMDQSIISGIGNIYSDEILWLSNIHPEKTVKKLDNEDIKKILNNTQKVLSHSIKIGGDSMSDYRNIYGEKGKFQNTHKVYKRTNQKCLKRNCNGIIIRKIIGGRSSHFCNIHQK